MPRKTTRTEIIYTDKSDKPSRFLVNLNNFIKEEQEKKEEARRSPGLKGFIRKLTEKKNPARLLANSGMIAKKGAAGAISKIRSLEQAAAGGLNIPVPMLRPEKTAPWLSHDRLRRLAFYPLVKGVFAGIFNIFKYFFLLCFKIGWLAVFLIRFCYFSALAVINPVSRAGCALFFLSVKNLKRLYVGVRKRREEAGAAEPPRAPEKPEGQKEDSAPAAVPGIRAAEIFLHSWDTSDRVPERRVEKRSFFRGLLPEKNIRAVAVLEEPETPGPDLGLYARFGLALKPALVFFIIIAVIILPIKAFTYYKNLNILRGRVMGISEEAVNSLAAGAESALQNDFKKAEENFSYASAGFIKAEDEIGEIGKILSVLKILPSEELKLAANAELILGAGSLGAQIGNHLSAVLNGLNTASEPDIKAIINNAHSHFQEIEKLSAELALKIAGINPEYLPEEYRSKFVELRSRTEQLRRSLEEFSAILEWSRAFLGFEKDTRYLLVFQNNTELRASGGFLGSFALVDMRDGRIKNMQVPGGGSYDTEAGLRERIIAPEPLSLVNPLWHFWDANWWPDWPTSARKLMWFYERSNGPTVDGVLSLTPTVMEKMLKIIGPVDMGEEYGVVIDADNFWQITQTFSEQKPKDHPAFRLNPYLATTTEELGLAPKKIIGDMMDKIISNSGQWLNRDTMIRLVAMLEESIRQKQVLFYFNDEAMQGLVDDMGWDGRTKETAWDYLSIINTNIAGGKSDRAITEEISHASEVGLDGSIINTLTITRRHNAAKGDEFTGVRNNDWMRIYVPAGSEFIEASGWSAPEAEYFSKPDENWTSDPEVAAGEGQAIVDTRSGTKIYQELRKTVFANWSQVDPGESAVITIKYKLPFKLEFSAESGLWNAIGDYLNPARQKLIPYALLVQKQPGSLGSAFKSVLTLPASLRSVWQYPEKTAVSSTGWGIEDVLTVDRFWAVLVEGD